MSFVEEIRMRARAIVVVCLGGVLMSGCGFAEKPRPVVDTAKIVDAIKTDEVHWNADWRSGDAARLAAHYAPEAVMMVPGTAPVVGQAAIRAALDAVVSHPGFSVTFSSDRVRVAGSGDLAAAHGTYRQVSPDPNSGAAVTQTGSYVIVYKPSADGHWRAVWDINTPGVAAAPATKVEK
jgi:uncharacterized protein (TIGR02246 family)